MAESLLLRRMQASDAERGIVGGTLADRHVFPLVVLVAALGCTTATATKTESELLPRPGGHVVLGAWRSVFGWVASDIATDLARTCSPHPRPGASGSTPTPRQRSFACRQIERTWAWPTAALAGRVLDLCLAELGATLRSDPVWNGR